MNKRKILSLSIVFFVFVFSIFSQTDPDLQAKYEKLLIDHETTLNDYGLLLVDYDYLLKNYNTQKKEYEVLSDKFTKLTDQHALDIKFHEGTKLSLLAANKTMESLENNVKQLLTIVDTQYFAVYPQIGYAGTLITGGIGITAQIPKFPISILLDVDYLHGLELPINVQVGIGIRF